MNIRLTATAAIAAGLLLTACADDVVVDAEDTTTEAPAEDNMDEAEGDVVEGDVVEGDVVEGDVVEDDAAVEGDEDHSEG